MPFKLLVVVLGVLGFVALSAYEAWTDVLDPLDCINLLCGSLFLLAMALGRDWMRPMGMTIAGVLIVPSLFVFFAMGSVFVHGGFSGGRLPMPRDQYTLTHFGVYASKFALGVLLLWAMRHRDVIGWIARRESKRLA